ncbi:hypothetical protein J2S00_001337 [Caldalkalibacillus uzonensis]|uniref:Uncharacterized protein n=1 Tax=Caldalkalibacillus uzonensis TaxID=353224 RepID=A0ABU0CRQ9_9BACI|nr:hypothetical protein [Caldalkalibacillus uzonensis]
MRRPGRPPVTCWTLWNNEPHLPRSVNSKHKVFYYRDNVHVFRLIAVYQVISDLSLAGFKKQQVRALNILDHILHKPG